MRLSTANLYDASIANLQRRQQALQEQQQQLTSGKRIATASDDPTGAARAERALAAIGRVDANQRALEASRNSMTLAESALGDANELLQQAREAMVAAGNASYSDAERMSQANKLQGIRDQLLSIANRPDGSGGYLFSGQGSSSPPFLDQAGGVTYVGVAGTIQTGNLDNFQLSIDGRATWEQARSGNGTFVTEPAANSVTGNPPQAWVDSGRVIDPTLVTGQNYRIDITGTAPTQTYAVTNTDTGAGVSTGSYTSGQAIKFDGISVAVTGTPADGDAFTIAPATNTLKVFDVLDRAISELKTPLRSNAQIAQSNSGRLRDLDAVMGGLQNVRSQTGERLNNLDGTETRLAALKQYNTQEKSAAEDIDMVQGISDFQNQQTGYDTALKTYAMVQRMSLFQYIQG
ncbi:flagellar hook-associated protein FlgL [Roseateles puraquae]|uniref:Flagellar hook-associated protein 3 n=1 Tax=Roseateles puraquae TaxID=431059 RepID=A0A254NI92_9BURK|nr:flagellar hook-associated protein FlgL [Roseateles puraquae]MDG0855208.1 flagellar hook-associated protein 3 [Roseateles puraquae]OWR05817.1 flagellar hook-associated protein 3 [Roseateles puraquae]